MRLTQFLGRDTTRPSTFRSTLPHDGAPPAQDIPVLHEAKLASSLSSIDPTLAV